MICKTLDGYEFKWKLDETKKTTSSGPHQKVKQFLSEKYPTVLILEEVQIQVKRNKYLYLDFYIPIYKMAIEIDGSHHREFNLFFSKNKLGFIKQKINDSLKEDWCQLNNIIIIRLSDKEKEDEWKNKLN